MKNKLSKILILTLLIFLNIGPLCVFAATLLSPTPINEVFPDPNLAAAVANVLRKNVTDTIDQNEADSQNFYRFGASIVKTFEGLQYLTALNEISFYHFTGTDLSPLKDANLTGISIFSAPNLTDISILSSKSLDNIEITYSKISDLSPLSGIKNPIRVNFLQNEISDVTPLKDMDYISLLILDNNHIADLSSLKNLNVDNFLAENQTINLMPTTNSGTLTIPNVVINADGNQVSINNADISDGGVYDPTTNSITWTGLTTQASVSYKFSSVSAAGFSDYAFSGTVTQPLTQGYTLNKYGYAIEYFKDDLSGIPIAIEYGKTTFDEGYQLREEDVNADFPDGWIDAHNSDGYEKGIVEGYPVIALPGDNIVKVLYTKIPTTNNPQDEEQNQVIITPEEGGQLPQTGEAASPNIFIGLCILSFGILILVRVRRE